MLRRLSLSIVSCGAIAAFGSNSPTHAADPKPTPIAEVKHDGPVDFQKEVLPILKKNCTACHNASKAEGDLVLESPATILKGGSSGPGAEGKKGAEALIVARAAAADDEQMPPADNKVGAKRLTSQELGLLKLWIDQGAAGSTSSTAEKIDWQPLPAGVNPIYAAAVTPDGQYAACGRANQIFVYHLPTGRVIGRLTDPALLKSGVYSKPGVADLDLIQSLAFSPDGQVLASGGFRTIKLWQRPAGGSTPALGGTVAGAKGLVASIDGKLAAVPVGNDVQLFDIAANKPAAKLTGAKGAVVAVAISADGKTVATAAADKTVRVYGAGDGKLAASAELPADALSVAVLADGTQIAAGAADGKVRIFGVKAGDAKLTAVREFATSGKKVQVIAVVPSNLTQIVTGDEAGNVAIWNTGDGKSVKAMQRTGGEITTVAVRADGKRIAAVGPDKSLRLWNAEDAKQIGESKGDLRQARVASKLERSVALAKAEVAFETAAIAEAEKNAKAEADAVKKAEETKTNAEKVQKEKTDAATKAATAKKDAEKAAADAAAAQKPADDAKAAAEKVVADADAAEKVAQQKANDAKAAAAKDAKDKKLADAKTAADKALTDAQAKTKTVKQDLTTKTQAATAAGQKAKTAADAVTRTVKPAEDAEKARADADAVVQSSIRAIASAQASSKKAADAVPAAQKRKADAETLQKKLDADLVAAQKTATDGQLAFRTVAFSPDGKLLVVGGDDKLVHTYSAETAAALDVLAGHAAPVRAVAFAGEKIVSLGDDGAAAAWSLYPEWTHLRTIGDPSSETLVDRVTALDFSPDGKQLVSGGGAPSRSGEVKIWNVADGKLVREVTDAHSDVVFGVRYSPDGKTLASCAADKFLKTFDVATGKFIRGYEGHTHHVLGAAWSADGRVLATGGADNVVKIWDVATGEQKRTVQGFGKEVTSIIFAGEGQNVLASCGDKSVKLLRADNGGVTRTYSGAGDFVYTCATTIDGKTVVAGGQDGVLRVWNADNGTETGKFEPPADATNEQASK